MEKEGQIPEVYQARGLLIIILGWAMPRGFMKAGTAELRARPPRAVWYGYRLAASAHDTRSTHDAHKLANPHETSPILRSRNAASASCNACCMVHTCTQSGTSKQDLASQLMATWSPRHSG